MPLSTPKPCAQVGCCNTTRERYCAEHKKERKNKSWGDGLEKGSVYTERNKRPFNPIYNSVRWRKLRRWHLRRQPTCQAPGCTKFATEVDHITPISAGGLPFDDANLQSLCTPHHARKTAKEYHEMKRAAER